MPAPSILQRLLGEGASPRDPYGTAMSVIRDTIEWATSDEHNGKMSERELANLNAMRNVQKELDPHA